MRCGSSSSGLVDETIDRVARKLDEGELVANARAYFYGVAKHVLLEWNRREAREQAAFAERHRLSAADVHSEPQEARIDCLKSCLQGLPEESRELILCYYEAGRGPSEETRKALADRLGISYGNLKIRAYRVREKLTACLGECLAKETGSR
jgi:RNA polymerase sigma factor (sigma-70 family)